MIWKSEKPVSSVTILDNQGLHNGRSIVLPVCEATSLTETSCSAHVHTEEYHHELLGCEPPMMQLIAEFLETGETNFMHIALWIIAQFSSVASEWVGGEYEWVGSGS